MEVGEWCGSGDNGSRTARPTSKGSFVRIDGVPESVSRDDFLVQTSLYAQIWTDIGHDIDLFEPRKGICARRRRRGERSGSLC